MEKERSIYKTHLNRLKDGRGQGRGVEYVPFIQSQDNKVASEGWLTRSLGWKTRRIHHTLSKHEYHYLLVQEWADDVMDIREQYPLTPIELTMDIAEKLKIKHPNVKGKNIVMTTDFMLSFVDEDSGELVDIARTIKPLSKLTKRTLELFEIERRYFKEMGIEWKIVLDNSKPLNMIKNIDWMYDAKYFGSRPGIDQELIDLSTDSIYKFLSSSDHMESISKNCLKSDSYHGLESGTSMFILKYMLANKIWSTDMNQLIRENKPLSIQKLEA